MLELINFLCDVSETNPCNEGAHVLLLLLYLYIVLKCIQYLTFDICLMMFMKQKTARKTVTLETVKLIFANFFPLKCIFHEHLITTVHSVELSFYT